MPHQSAAAITIVSGLAILPFWLPMRAAEVFAMPAGLVLFHLIAQGLVLGCVAMFFFARAVELLGATRAATLSVMVPVVALLLAWGLLPYAVAVLLLIYAQTPLMMRFMRDPVGRALSLSAFGVPLLVAGMMVSAFAWRNAPQHLITSQADANSFSQAQSHTRSTSHAKLDL